MNNITLIGMPGSGKSTVGVLLAKSLGFQFVDVDLLIQQREGALLQELLDNRGVEPFLDAEEAAVRSLACTGAVIAPGGSAVCRAGAIGHLRALGRVVYLHVPLPELERRIHNITTRGIAMAPGQTLADVYAAREPLYRRYADLTVDVGEGRGLEETVAALFPADQGRENGELLTNARQADAARRALEAVTRASESLEAGITPDALLTDAEEALAALGELTGASVREDVTARIFERFCVGK